MSEVSSIFGKDEELDLDELQPKSQFDFSAVMADKKAEAERLKKDRETHNAKVKAAYKIKTKKK